MLAIVKMIGTAVSMLLSLFGAVQAIGAAWWSLKVGRALAVTATYTLIWATIVGLVGGLLTLMPEHGFGAFARDFMPSPWAIGVAGAAVWGTKASKYAFGFWLRHLKSMAM